MSDHRNIDFKPYFNILRRLVWSNRWVVVMNAAVHSVVQARVDPELKREASEVLGDLGITTSAAIRMLLVRVVAERALPFAAETPNEVTQEAISASRAGDVESFASLDELFVDLKGS